VEFFKPIGFYLLIGIEHSLYLHNPHAVNNVYVESGTWVFFCTMASMARVRRARTRPPRVEMKIPARLVSVIPCSQQAGQCNTLLPEVWSVWYPARNKLVSVIPCLQQAGQCDTLLTAGWSVWYTAHNKLVSPIPYSQQARLCDTLLTASWSVWYPAHIRLVSVIHCSIRLVSVIPCSH
jgi:hypothetical protein